MTPNSSECGRGSWWSPQCCPERLHAVLVAVDQLLVRASLQHGVVDVAAVAAASAAAAAVAAVSRAAAAALLGARGEEEGVHRR
jgi:hypothetical protein